MPVPVVGLPPAAPGISAADLMVIAELGYHYLMSGGLELAQEIFSGLSLLAPEEPYFPLALALTSDRLGNKAAAHRAYDRAARLSPKDPQPDLNRAELYIEEGDHASARTLLTNAAKKAKAAKDGPLLTKAECLLRHIGGGR